MKKSYFIIFRYQDLTMVGFDIKTILNSGIILFQKASYIEYHKSESSVQFEGKK